MILCFLNHLRAFESMSTDSYFNAFKKILSVFYFHQSALLKTLELAIACVVTQNRIQDV